MDKCQRSIVNSPIQPMMSHFDTHNALDYSLDSPNYASVTTDQLEYIPNKLECVTANPLERITANKLERVTANQLDNAAYNQLEYPSTNQLDYVTNKQLNNMNNYQLEHITTNQTEYNNTGNQSEDMNIINRIQDIASNQTKFYKSEDINQFKHNLEAIDEQSTCLRQSVIIDDHLGDAVDLDLNRSYGRANIDSSYCSANIDTPVEIQSPPSQPYFELLAPRDPGETMSVIASPSLTKLLNLIIPLVKNVDKAKVSNELAVGLDMSDDKSINNLSIELETELIAQSSAQNSEQMSELMSEQRSDHRSAQKSEQKSDPVSLGDTLQKSGPISLDNTLEKSANKQATCHSLKLNQEKECTMDNIWPLLLFENVTSPQYFQHNVSSLQNNHLPNTPLDNQLSCAPPSNQQSNAPPNDQSSPTNQLSAPSYNQQSVLFNNQLSNASPNNQLSKALQCYQTINTPLSPLNHLHTDVAAVSDKSFVSYHNYLQNSTLTQENKELTLMQEGTNSSQRTIKLAQISEKQNPLLADASLTSASQDVTDEDKPLNIPVYWNDRIYTTKIDTATGQSCM